MSTARGWTRIVLGAALVVAGACGGDGERGGTAAGEAATGQVAALDYEVTPERYRRWVAAQQALDATPNLPAPPKLDPMRFGEPEIRRAVEYLERDPRARAALARAGISARDYVLTTVALDQALVAAAASPPPSGAAPAISPTGAAPAISPTGAAPAISPTGAAPQPATKQSGGGGTAAVPSTTAIASRPRITGAPPRNVDLVRRNRGDIVRVLRTMRFRISEPAADDIADTAVTRSDSVTVGKGVTVKWDVTVRRNRDSARAARDSSRPDST
jgi:hypothetical protein